MYVAASKNVVVALDAATGKEIWTSTEQATERGLTYWESRDRSDRRLILTTGNGIRADRCANREADRRPSAATVSSTCGPASPRRLGGPNKSPGRDLREPVHRRVEYRRRVRIAARRPARLRRRHAGSWSGRFTRSRVPESSATRPGRPMPGSTPAARTRGATSRSTGRTASCFCRPDRRRTISTAPIAPADNLFGNCLLALDARTGKRLLALPDRAPRSLGLRSWRGAKAADGSRSGTAGQHDRHRRAGGEDRIPLRLRAAHRKAALADRRAAGAEERGAWRGLVADAADSHEAAAVRAPGVQRLKTSTRS